MAVVRARRDDEIRIQAREHSARLGVVEAKLEAGPRARLLELAQPPVALLRATERARDVDDAPTGVA
jgi:hypothetical protein